MKKLLNKLRRSKGKRMLQYFQQLEELAQQLPPIKLPNKKYVKANKLYPICFYDKTLHKLIFYYYKPELLEQFQQYIMHKYNIEVEEKDIKQILEFTKVALPKPKNVTNIEERIQTNISNMEEVGLVDEEEYERMLKLLIETKKLDVEEKSNKQPIKLILEKIKEVDEDV